VVSQIATSVKELERFARSNYHDPIIELPQTATKQHVKPTATRSATKVFAATAIELSIGA